MKKRLDIFICGMDPCDVFAKDTHVRLPLKERKTAESERQGESKREKLV